MPRPPRSELKPPSGACKGDSPHKRRGLLSRYHLNSSWSVWYSVCVLAFSSYLVCVAVRKFFIFVSLPWPAGAQPYVELNAFVGLVGAAVVLQPFFFIAGVIKVGNLANDGGKLGASLSTCSRDPPAILEPSRGIIRNMWLHGIPTAPFLHLVSAFCLLLPGTFMDAVLVKNGFLPMDQVWKTDIDFVISNHDRWSLFSNPPITFPESSDVIHSTEVVARLVEPGKFLAPDGSRPEPVVEYLKKDRRKEKSKGKNHKRGRKFTVVHFDELPPSSESSTLPTSTVVYTTTNRTTSTVVQNLDSLENLTWYPVSPQFINYVLALLVVSVRYPSVFWHTNKTFGLIFTFQMMLNSMQSIVTVMAFSVLYKIRITNTKLKLWGEDFVMGEGMTSLITVVSLMTVTFSSSALYFYGFQRFSRFLVQSRQRYMISFDGNPPAVRAYVPHCLALLVLVTLGGSYGFLLTDFTLVYRGSLDSLMLAAVIGTIVYLFLWIVLWLFLTLKSDWVFKLRVTVSRACVASARSIKLLNDVEMSQSHLGADCPLLVVGNGKAYAINDMTPRKAIMGVVQKTLEDKRAKGAQDEVYWLRPSAPQLNRGPSSGKGKTTRSKVTFDEPDDASPRKIKLGKSPKVQKSTYRRAPTISDSDDEGGDYAFLKGGPGFSYSSGPEAANRAKGRFDNEARYVDQKQVLLYHRDLNEANPSSPSVTSRDMPDYEDADDLPLNPQVRSVMAERQIPVSPRSNRSNDSGVPPEEPSQRSDTSSMASSSNTPQENSEESGCHSGALDLAKKRSNSVDDLTQLPPDPNLLLSPNPMQRPPLMSISSPYGYCRKNIGSHCKPTVFYPASESMVVIRRPRNIIQDIKPPADPIYGARSLSSFTDHHNTHQMTSEQTIGKKPPSEYVQPQGHFTSSNSYSSGYQSTNASTSSASNSASNSPIPPKVGSSNSSPVGITNGSKGMNYHAQTQKSCMPRVNLQSPSNPYNRSASPKLPQAPQIPLPPIPQGAEPQVHSTSYFNYGNDHYRHTDFAPQHKGYDPYTDTGVPHGEGRSLVVGRSYSLRLPSHSVSRHVTNTLPHVLPRESQYNTSV